MLKVIKLNESTMRVVYGDLYEEIDIEWGKYDLDELRKMLEILLDSHPNDLKSLKKKRTKSIKVYKGGHHIDIVGDGGSLNILKVVDHPIVPDLDD